MKRRAWTVEALESRDLPSAAPVFATRPAVARAAVVAVAEDSGGSGITADPYTPRPGEVARRAFVARFTGTVRNLPPRLYNEARQFAITAPGSSNQFLHGTLQMKYFTPLPPATQTTGAASLSDRNESNGAVLLLDLTGDPADVDRRGRPTRFNFTVNGGGGSDGIYASSVGGGILNIAYRGNKATVTIRGSVYTSGVGDPLVIFSSNRA